MTQPTARRVYFENLNAIRFFAAFLVIVTHVEQLKGTLKLPNRWADPCIGLLGELGVILFFALSGFLISYLLFVEQQVTNDISIKYFYIRRILRIWPLYFFVIALSLFVLPFVPLFTWPDFDRATVWYDLGYKIVLYILILPNLVLTSVGIVPYAFQTWSIGAEEQFYLVWPLLVKKVKNKWWLMWSVIIIYIGVKFLNPLLLPSGNAATIFNNFWNTTPIDCMAIGGCFALLIFENNAFTNKIKTFIFQKSLQWFVLILSIVCILNGVKIPYFNYEYYALLFSILIVNFAANEQRIFSMEHRLSNYLGNISYGLYMYHPIAIVLSIRILQYLNLYFDVLLYPISLLVAIVMASVSYHYFEKYFIDKKEQYTKVLSGKSKC